MRVVLIATYELGRQPFGLASPAAWLREAGHEVIQCDVSRDVVDPDDVAGAGLVALHLPMHTATRLALPVIERVRQIAPSAHVCAFGLYAPPNADYLRGCGVHTILGPEFEADLCGLADTLSGAAGRLPLPAAGLPRLAFRVPDRQGLPPLTRYARLEDGAGGHRVVGATDASRGCKHLCRHCPVVPLYNGQFRVVPRDVVLADIAQQVACGATHITFGDPDFFNGVTHALRIVEALAARHPGVTYDATIKVEHLLAHQQVLPALVATGCAFVTSAFESFDDAVLGRLAKGHTRADAEAVVANARIIGLQISPTFVAFTPWTSNDSYGTFLDTIASWGLVEVVAPVQLALRLLLPTGSLLRSLADVAVLAPGFSPSELAYHWNHPDPRMDALQRAVMEVVTLKARRPRHEAFDAVVACAQSHGVRVTASADRGRTRGVSIATLDEPWYC